MTDLAKFPSGLSVNGVPVLGGGNLVTTGTVYFVDSTTGSNASDRGTDASTPFGTLAYAYDQCTADKGDIIFLMPGHAENITATIALDTACVSIIGLGNGSKRPKLSMVTTGSDNLFEVSAAGIVMSNIWFYDAAVGGTAPEVFIDISATGDDFTLINCRLEQRTQVTEAITIGATNDVSFVGCQFLGTSIGPDAAITCEAATVRLSIINCGFNYVEAAGCDSANILFEASKNDEVLIKGCYTIGLMEDEEFVQALVGSSSSTSGMIVDCFGRIEELSAVIVQSNAFTVINSYFAESGNFTGGCLPAGTDDLSRWVPALTATS